MSTVESHLHQDLFVILGVKSVDLRLASKMHSLSKRIAADSLHERAAIATVIGIWRSKKLADPK